MDIGVPTYATMKTMYTKEEKIIKFSGTNVIPPLFLYFRNQRPTLVKILLKIQSSRSSSTSVMIDFEDDLDVGKRLVFFAIT